MGFFDWLNKALNPEPPIILEHPYFGKLKYVSGSNIHGGKYENWEGELLTPISPNPLIVFIKADIHGPKEEHKVRMQELFERFPLLQNEIFRVLFEEWTETLKLYGSDLSDWPQFSKQENMADLFELGSIEICSGEEYKYELQYSYRGDLGEYDTTAHFLAIDKNWTVSYSGGAD